MNLKQASKLIRMIEQYGAVKGGESEKRYKALLDYVFDELVDTTQKATDSKPKAAKKEKRNAGFLTLTVNEDEDGNVTLDDPSVLALEQFNKQQAALT